MKLQNQIEQKLTANLTLEHLEVINESQKHNVPEGSELHFRIVLVSPTFSGKPLIDRHRMINEILSEELKESIHALSLQTLTPAEWAMRNKEVKDTPPCQGGSKE